MAQMKPILGSQAQRLANLWGQKFGNEVYKLTLGMMRNYLRGNAEKGLPAYRFDHIQGCIEWLYEAQEAKKLKKPVTGPGVIAYVIQDFIEGKAVTETFLGQENRTRKVKML